MITFAGETGRPRGAGAAFVAFAANLPMVAAAIVSILLLGPRGKSRDESRPGATAPAGARSGARG